MISACSIIAANYGAFARVLADSFFAHHPAGSFTVLLIDDEGRQLAPPDSRIDWRRLADIGLDPAEIHRLAGMYDVTELSTAVKPMLLRRLLDEGRSEVIYLDPDIRVYDRLEPIAALARQHGVVLTPHTMAPMPKDGRQVDDLHILAAGVYNLGFIAVGQAARPFLDWWWQSTRREALNDVTRMMFTDQRWIDFAPSLFDHHLLKDPGCNVAYWNLHGRKVTSAGDRYLVDGVPLRFFHFSGFEVDKPWLLSRHQGTRPRVLLSEQPVLARICEEYAVCLRQAGFDAATRLPYGWRAAAAGFDLNTRMRRLYWAGLRAAEQADATEPPDPFDAANPQAFLAWLNEPAEAGPRRISRYLHAIYANRVDLQVAFRDLHGRDAERFADWVWRDGVEEEGIIVELLPPREGDAGATIASAQIAPAEGLCIVGLHRPDMGAGEAAHRLALAAGAAQIPYSTIAWDEFAHRQHHPAGERPEGQQPNDINVLCMNADATARFARDIGPGFFAHRHTVGYWLSEIEPRQAVMHEAFDHVDEVWAATDQMAGVFRAARRKPVFTVPLPALMPADSPVLTRRELGLPDRCVFLLAFDFLSDPQRSDASGIIEAFTTAFAPNEGPVLVVAGINGDLRVPDLERLRLAAPARADVVVLDRHDRAASTAASGDSGHVYFMTTGGSFLVDDAIADGPDGSDSVPAGARWADRDVAQAARVLRDVYDRPDDAARLAGQRRAGMLERYGVQVAAAALARRVGEIRHERRAPPASAPTPNAGAPPAPDPPAVAFQTMVPNLQRLDSPGPNVAGRPLPALRLVRRALFRLLKPGWFQPRQLEPALAGAVPSSTGALAGDIAALNIATAPSRRDADLRATPIIHRRARADAAPGDLSQRLFAPSAPVERSSNGEVRLGYGAATIANGRGHLHQHAAETVSVTRRRVYLPLLEGRARILDVDCGLGGMLDLLRVARMPAIGIDPDSAMVAHCRANGHAVEQADPVAFLRAQACDSIGAIFSARLTRLLPIERLQAFLRLCHSRLEPGGVLIAETANPPRLAAIDPGAAQPLPRESPTISPRAISPEVALALCHASGFEQAYVVFPTGTGDLDVDRISEARYAVVAVRGQG